MIDITNRSWEQYESDYNKSHTFTAIGKTNRIIEHMSTDPVASSPTLTGDLPEITDPVASSPTLMGDLPEITDSVASSPTLMVDLPEITGPVASSPTLTGDLPETNQIRHTLSHELALRHKDMRTSSCDTSVCQESALECHVNLLRALLAYPHVKVQGTSIDMSKHHCTRQHEHFNP